MIIALATSSQAEPGIDIKPTIETPASEERRGDVSDLTGRAKFFSIVSHEAQRYGLPIALADAVVTVESGYDASAVGTVGEVGLMQVRPSTAAMLGFSGEPPGLFDPQTNLRLGIRYLAQAWKLAGGDLCRTLMKYRAGHGEERMTERSVAYCRRARDYLATIGSPLAAATVPALIAKSAQKQAILRADVELGRVPQRYQEERRRFDERRQALVRKLWQDHVARIKAIEPKIARIMSGD